MEIEGSCDSLDHNFLIFPLEKYALCKNFMSWENILLRDQELSILSGGTMTKYFLLWRGAFTFHFLYFGDLFSFIKSKPEIKRLTIFDHYYLLSACASDTTFFLTIFIFLNFFHTFLD